MLLRFGFTPPMVTWLVALPNVWLVPLPATKSFES
jgi:hypothetical protein